MPIQKTEGVLLKKRDLRQTSIIVTFYTKDFGKISGVLKGVRGERPAASGVPQLFGLNQIVFYEKKKSDFFIISHCELKNFFSKVRNDFEKLTIATYLIELVDNFTEQGEPNEELFGLLVDSLTLLATPISPKRVARIFEIKMLELLGLIPRLDNCVNCGKPITSDAYFSNVLGGVLDKDCLGEDKSAPKILSGTMHFISHISRLPFDKVGRIKVSEVVGKEVEKILRNFIDFQLDRSLKTVEFFRKVNSNA